MAVWGGTSMADNIVFQFLQHKQLVLCIYKHCFKPISHQPNDVFAAQFRGLLHCNALNDKRVLGRWGESAAAQPARRHP